MRVVFSYLVYIRFGGGLGGGVGFTSNVDVFWCIACVLIMYSDVCAGVFGPGIHSQSAHALPIMQLLRSRRIRVAFVYTPTYDPTSPPT